MTTSKLARMAFSHHSRYSASETPVRCLHHAGQEKRATGPWGDLIQALLRQYRVHRLLMEKKRLQRSFERVAAALGLPTDRQQHTPQQQQRLVRIRQIEAELRTINYPQTTK